MPARLLSITDSKKRDAQISVDGSRRPPPVRYAREGGGAVRLERLVKTTEATTYEALAARAGGEAKLAASLVDGDPEVDLAAVGRPMGDAARVYTRGDGTVLFAARVVQVVYAADGTEKERREFLDVEASVGEDTAPLPWSGRLFSADEVVRKFALVRKLQLRHVNGLTFDFLLEIARSLEAAGKLLYVGAGAKAQSPLVFTTNGTPYRGFLEGRTSGESYRLVLHLSNLELKSVVPAPAAAAGGAS